MLQIENLSHPRQQQFSCLYKKQYLRRHIPTNCSTSKLKKLINSGCTNQKWDQPNILTIKGFIIVNLCHRPDKKKEVELAKMENQHALILMTLLLATVFAQNLMEASSKLLWVRIHFLILVLCWVTIIQSVFYLLTLWQRCIVSRHSWTKFDLQPNSWAVTQADCHLRGVPKSHQLHSRGISNGCRRMQISVP